MADDFGEFYDFYDENVRLVPPRRYLRDAENPLEIYTDEQFKRRYRFTKNTVVNMLVPLIENDITSPNRRGLPFPALMKLLISLRFYATGSYQLLYGDLFHISQSSVCRTISTVSNILAHNVKRFVKFPSAHQDFDKLKRLFYLKSHFPGVIGIVDGTHIPIKSPGGNQGEVFRNRKGFFSLNVQVVAGPEEEILDIVVRWPGSAHDARIFENSGVRVKLGNGSLPGHLLGDSGYPQKTFIYTPVPHPATEAERNYNRSHAITRSLVERTIGRWKRRFPCLYFELQNSMRNITRIVTACAVLYNIGIKAGDTWDLDELEGGRVIPEIPAQAAQENLRGNVIRQQFIERHF